MFVTVSYFGGGSGGANQISGITWNGSGSPIALTKLGSVAGNGGDAADIWMLLNPASHVSGTVAITYVAGSNSGSTVQVYTFAGVDQIVGANNFTSSASASNGETTRTVTVASAMGNLVLDVVCEGASGVTFTAGGLQTVTYDANTNPEPGAGSIQVGAVSVTMSWTIGVGTSGGITDSCQAAVNILAAVNFSHQRSPDRPLTATQRRYV